jgi:hypothetical protein
MKNQVKALDMLSNSLQTKKDGISLLDSLVKFNFTLHCLKNKSEEVICHLETILSKELNDENLSLCLQIDKKFEFSCIIDKHNYGISLDCVYDDLEDIVPTFHFPYKVEIDASRDKPLFRLIVNFYVVNYEETLIYHESYICYHDHDLNAFISKIDSITIDQLIQDLKLSNFLDDKCLEDTCKTIKDSLRFMMK